MYAVKCMDFYIKFSGAFGDDKNDGLKRVDYVGIEEASKFSSIIEAANQAEAMAVSGFEVEKV